MNGGTFRPNRGAIAYGSRVGPGHEYVLCQKLIEGPQEDREEA